MEYDNNTLIVASRQSGKTFALVRKFVETRDSALFFNYDRRHIDELLIQLGCPDRRRDVYRMSESTIRGRRMSAMFMDEIDAYDGNLQEVWANVAPALNAGNGRIVAVTTPRGNRTLDQYNSIFFNIFNMNSDSFERTIAGKSIRVEKPIEHFDKELFEI